MTKLSSIRVTLTRGDRTVERFVPWHQDLTMQRVVQRLEMGVVAGDTITVRDMDDPTCKGVSINNNNNRQEGA